MINFCNHEINFILHNRRSIEHYPNSSNEIILEYRSATLLTKLNEEWIKIFSETISDISEIPSRIARLEAASFQFILLGCVIAKFGSDKQCNIYCSKVMEIFKMIENKHGNVALVNAPEIIILEIIYYIGVLCVVNMNLMPLKVLLDTKICDYDKGHAPVSLISRDELHYSQALGGHSTKVNDHIRDSIINNNWLSMLEPKIKNKETDLQLQVNFLLVMLTLRNNYLWPDFARFYAYRVTPLINKIKFNDEFSEQVCSFLDVNKEDLYAVLKSRLELLIKRGLDRYHWHSIYPDIFDTV